MSRPETAKSPGAEALKESAGCCALSRGNAPIGEQSPHEAPIGVVEFSNQVIEIAGGETKVGTNQPVYSVDGEGPVRRVALRPFKLDACAVTNARFGAFVGATGYRTDAERFGWSFVFRGLLQEGTAADFLPEAPWWLKVQSAYWAAPEGPGSSTTSRADHPATHISWNDATAFAKWAGGRLPSEAEWEHAAKGGDLDARFPWGDREPDDQIGDLCNIWQGDFPAVNTAVDRFTGTAPVNSFRPNRFGLFNMCGNVWEWCSDRFRIRSLTSSAKARNKAASAESHYLMKGGSFLCHQSYCYRYRIAARVGNSPDTSASHTGFRVAYELR
jgi:formylglycine-generating enzyme required for sulfatase activity